MISSNDLKPGMTIQQDGEIFVVLEQSQNKTARSAMVVKAKVRNLRTGANVELSWGGGDKITPAHIEKKEMQYLYDAEDALVFMDNETYEQIEIPADNLKWEINFLKESDEVEVTSYEGEVLGVSLPINVPFKVIETEPAVRGDTATGATKNAVIETGYQIKVPLFISEGEVVIVNTVDGKYQGRA